MPPLELGSDVGAASLDGTVVALALLLARCVTSAPDEHAATNTATTTGTAAVRRAARRAQNLVPPGDMGAQRTRRRTRFVFVA